MRFVLALLVALIALPAAAGEHADARVAMVTMQHNSVGDGRVLRLGDSIAEGFWWDSVCLRNANGWMINGGIGWAGVQTISDKLPQMLATAKPAIVTLMIGVNDTTIGNTQTLADWAAVYDGIVQAIIKSGATPVLYTILPVAEGAALGSLYFDQAKIDERNAHIKAYAAARNLLHYDLDQIFKNEGGYMLQQYTYDGVHLTGAGYAQLFYKIQDGVIAARARRGQNCYQ